MKKLGNFLFTLLVGAPIVAAASASAVLEIKGTFDKMKAPRAQPAEVRQLADPAGEPPMVIGTTTLSLEEVRDIALDEPYFAGLYDPEINGRIFALAPSFSRTPVNWWKSNHGDIAFSPWLDPAATFDVSLDAYAEKVYQIEKVHVLGRICHARQQATYGDDPRRPPNACDEYFQVTPGGS